MQLIEKTEDLNLLCQKLSNEEFICVDLEFMREHTYFAKLCLIQIASLNDAAIIDPLSADINLDAFISLMQNPSVVKVFHSGRQDIEIIYNISGTIPHPLFDTQIAAQVAGFGEAVSYENLVIALLHQTIDKSSRLSDWSKRPLTQNQLNYAISDVTHLVHIYQHLKKWLEDKERTSWIEDELKIICDEKTYKINPDDMWQKIRHRSHNARFLTILQALAAWREKRAIEKNVPRHSFIKDDLLLNICAECPQTKEELASIRGMRSDIACGKLGTEILDVLQNVKQVDKKDYAKVCENKEFSVSSPALFNLLKMLLQIVAQEQKVTPRIIATENDLKAFVSGDIETPQFMNGWRFEIFGKHALKISQGQTAIRFTPENNRIEFFSPSE